MSTPMTRCVHFDRINFHRPARRTFRQQAKARPKWLASGLHTPLW